MTIDTTPSLTERWGVRTTRKGAFMLGDMLEKGGLAPVVRRRPPYWNPPVPAALGHVAGDVHIPGLEWDRWYDVAEGTAITPIDSNAGYVSAASSATFAHGALVNRGQFPDTEYIRPGYYWVDVHPWQGHAPGSPLGAKAFDGPFSRVWVTHVTYRLLRDLTYGTAWCPPGQWPDATAYDTWLSDDTGCRFTNWTNAIRDLRSRIIDAGDTEAYAALKLGYSQAQQMWLTPPDPKGTPKKDCKKVNAAYRPDWAHTIQSQHAMNMWRRAYVATLAGHPPVQLCGPGLAKDGMAFTTSDFTAVLALPKAPIVMDTTGKRLGTFKKMRQYFHGQDIADEMLG